MITKILDGIGGLGYHGEKALNSIKEADILGKVKEGSKYTSDAIKQGYIKAKAMDNQPKPMATKVEQPPKQPRQVEFDFGDMK